jgi:hypothetical protein
MCETTLAAREPVLATGQEAVASTGLTIGEIFRQYGPAYREKYAGRMSYDHLQVMSLLERCRTGELGIALFRCQACARYHSMPRSCGNRHCPTCQGHKAKQWLEKQLEKLLPCPYFLITFTVPKELRRCVRAHRRECYRALFNAAAATLIKLAQDPKYVGSSKLGFTGVLHTWGRSLTFHPHVHFMVPGGAISEDGQSWLPSGAEFFVPVKAASIIFRAKFKQLMEDAGLIDQIPPAVWTKSWVVHSKAVGDGRKALRYLAPYVYRVAISNRRIVKCEPGPDGLGRVAFTYRPSGSRDYRVMTLTAEQFIRRFLQHVLPRGFQKVRHFGFAHPRYRIDREWLQMLVTVTLSWVYVLLVAAKPLPIPYRPACPHCGGPLSYMGMISEHDWPFAAYDTS